MEGKNEEENKGIGQIGDKYIILQKLSFGGQANVFLVKDMNTNLKYAAKIPKFKDNYSLEGEIRILNILKREKTPNIINIIESGRKIIMRSGRTPETSNYLILELATKRSLDEYIRFPEDGFGETFGKVIFYKIVKNIQVIHQKGICHRDIKIDNILLDGDDFDMKISDFGHSIEYNPQLTGICGTDIYEAPEINKVYDGYKIDIFSLGPTLMALTYGIQSFELTARISRLYRWAISSDSSIVQEYWNILKKSNPKIEEASADFKDLFLNMIHENPDKRIPIEQILQHKWFGEISSKTPEQLRQYEIEIKLKDELIRRELIINEKLNEEIKMVNKNSDNKYHENTHVTKSTTFDSNSNIFKDGLNLKYVEKDKYMNYCLYIKGILEPNDFMYMIYQKIIDEYPNCLISNEDGDKPKFNVVFKGEGMFANIKEQLKKLKIEKEEKEEEDDDVEEKGKNELIIKIKLYKTKKGYLLRFVKKQGNKYDFIKKFEDIKKLVKEII